MKNESEPGASIETSGSRRRFLTSSGSSVAALWLAGQVPGLVHGQSAAENRMIVPGWQQVPTCMASSADRAGQGPFYIHEDETQNDVSLFREDIRGQYDPAAEPGTEMQLHLRIVNSTAAQCQQLAEPLSGVVVYIWHCDAQGYYSGFGNPGDQNPDQVYRGKPGPFDLNNADRYCRGAALSDANGVASFRSVFPGWYNGRDVHIHFMAISPDADMQGRRFYRGSGHIFTTQFYFAPALIEGVHQASQPYERRMNHPAYQGVIQGDERGNSGLRARADFDGSKVVAQLQIALDPQLSVPGGFRMR